jgi:hypothetical protein
MADQFMTALHGVIDMVKDAKHDAEVIVGGRLPNVEHYALLGRLDALAADVGRLVADTLAPLLAKKSLK